MQLSKKQRNFCHFFAALLKCRLNLEQDDYHSLRISDVTDCERCG